jgi:hypothetical protein
MFSLVLFFVSTLKALVEIAGMSLLAQGFIVLFSGKARQDNFIYRLFQVITAPVIKIARAMITPEFITDAYLGLISFIILFWLWLALVFAKGYVCLTQNLACYLS